MGTDQSRSYGPGILHLYLTTGQAVLIDVAGVEWEYLEGTPGNLTWAETDRVGFHYAPPLLAAWVWVKAPVAPITPDDEAWVIG